MWTTSKLVACAIALIGFAFQAHADGIVNPPLGASSGSPGTITNNATTGDVIVGGASTAAIKDSTTYGTNGGISLSGGVVPSYNACYWNDTDACTTENVRLRERVFVGNGVLMVDNQTAAEAGTFLSSSSVGANWIPRDAQFLSMTDRGVIAVAGVAQNVNTPASHSAIGVAGYAMNNTITTGLAWAGYFEAQFNPTTVAGSAAYGAEIDCTNGSATISTGDPYVQGSGCFALTIGTGGGGYGISNNVSNAAIYINKGQKGFSEGIVINSAALASDANSNQIAISLGAGAGIKWYVSNGSPGATITSNALNTVNLGGLDTATPATQFIAGQNAQAGTANTKGGDVVIQMGKGTGTQSSGLFSIQTAAGGTTGSSQNALSTIFGVNASNAAVTVGSLSIAQVASVTGSLQIAQAQQFGGGGLVNINYQPAANAPANISLALSRGAINVQTAVVSSDQLGTIIGAGSDGTNFIASSKIRFEASGTVSTGIVPGLLRLQTASTAGTLTDAMLITNAQIVVVPAAEVVGSGSQHTFPNAGTGVLQNYSTASNPNLLIDRSSVDTTGASIALYKVRAGIAGNGIVVAGDQLGVLNFYGDDGAGTFGNPKLAGTISVSATGTISTGIVPGLMQLFTANASGTGTLGLQIDSGQIVGFGPNGFTADASTAACVGSLGPVGIHATVQEWLTVRDNAGTLRYIPAC